MSGHDAARTGCANCRDPVTAVEESPAPIPMLRFPGAVPNPLRGGGVLRFDLPERGTVLLRVFDVRGRAVRRLMGPEPGSSRRGAMRSSGTDDESGRRLPSGVYFMLLDAGGTAIGRKVVLAD